MKICVWLQTGAVLIPFFQQFTGINTIMFYATQLFAVLGQSGDAALLSTAIVGAVNVGSTIIAIILVDRSVCMSKLELSPPSNSRHTCSPLFHVCCMCIMYQRCYSVHSTASCICSSHDHDVNPKL